MNSSYKNFVPHFLAVFIFFILSAAYFYPQLQNKSIRQGDIVSHKAISQEVKDFKAETGETSYWTNSIFGGMPTYQINTISEGNLLIHLLQGLRLFFKSPIGTFFMMMVCFYISMVLLGVNPWLSMIAGVAFAFTTNNVILFEAGHNTKLNTIAFLAPIAAGILLTFREKYKSGLVLFGIGLGLNIACNHVQMTYYFMLTILILGVILVVDHVRNKKLDVFGKAAGLLIITAIIAAGTAANNLLPTQEYAQDTMRGKPILENEKSKTASTSSEVEGLEWSYATNWSNGVIDLFSSVIPGVVGGGSLEQVPKSSPLRKDSRWQQLTSRYGGKAPMYWGGLNGSTAGPAYLGIISCFLFLMGLVLVKGKEKWWMGGALLFVMLLSLGYNASWFNRTLFDYFPLFNKFRTPNSALTIAPFFISFLGIMALSGIVSKKYKKPEILKSLYISGGILGAICLFFALLGGSFFDFSASGDANFSQGGLDVGVLQEARKSLMQSDAFRSLIFLLLSGGLIWAFAQEKLKNKNILIAGIGLLILFDFWGVDRRYVSTDDFLNQSSYNQSFQKRPADDQIMKIEKGGRGFYRVFDMGAFASATPSYYHNTIGGYSAAKLQRYQDMIDRHITKNNVQVLNMLNAKYLISGEGQMQPNPNANGTAWFVNAVKKVNTPNEEIDALGAQDFDSRETAVVHTEFENYLSGLQTQKQGNIQLTEYAPNALTYKSSSQSEQLAVFSEIWYGPDKGWQAYIDDQPVEHIRANYLLRAMRIPAGEHSIRFEFAPSIVQTGKTISFICSLILLLGLAYVIWDKWKNRPAPSIEQTQAAHKKATPTKSKRKKKK